MLAGALLGVVFALLLFVPGVIPWWNYSSPFGTWGLGVVFGFAIGCGVTSAYRGACLVRREHRRESDLDSLAARQHARDDVR
jgi:ABC-type antimicrobial peptide transport system permease subunit